MKPRRFNIAGPCRSSMHYMLPPDRRLIGVRDLIDSEEYFVVHAPRQTGKTTALLSLASQLTQSGQYAAVLVTAETGAPFHDIDAAEHAILRQWRNAAQLQLPPELRPPDATPCDPGSRISTALQEWSLACPRPLVLFIDEIDALSGDVLISILRQLRAGYPSHPTGFPAALAMIGLRDVRDYKTSGTGESRLGTSSPFNIKTESISLRDFTADEIVELYAQHTADTGQPFDPEALARVWELTRGQPWLVNALAREAVARVPAPTAITRVDIDRARDTLIARNDTHLDSLAERLREPRVQAVIEPILAGDTIPSVPFDDLQFVQDLGLVRLTAEGNMAIANPIYSEVIPRVLTTGPRYSLPSTIPSWRRPDGTLDAEQLMAAFLAFWRQHGQPLLSSAPYHEIAPHLVFLAFLDRVANGSGYISRDYAIGSGRIDVMLEYGPGDRREKFAFELKVHRDDRPDPQSEGLKQLDRYLAGAGLESGWLVIFDRRTGLPPLAERVSVAQAETPSGRKVQVVRG